LFKQSFGIYIWIDFQVQITFYSDWRSKRYKQ